MKKNFFLFSNQAIADYLTTNGYTISSKEFCREANIVGEDFRNIEIPISLGFSLPMIVRKEKINWKKNGHQSYDYRRK
jgi:hypothetical protein